MPTRAHCRVSSGRQPKLLETGLRSHWMCGMTASGGRFLANWNELVILYLADGYLVGEADPAVITTEPTTRESRIRLTIERDGPSALGMHERNTEAKSNAR